MDDDRGIATDAQINQWRVWLDYGASCPTVHFQERILARLDAAERERNALKDENALLRSQIRQLNDLIAARVAEEVNPYAALRDQVVRYYDGLPDDVEVPEFVETARRLKEADCERANKDR